MEFGILGPLVVWRNGRVIPIGAAKQRALLTLLLLRRGELVPTETLVDELWGEPRPATAVKLVQVYVSQLRKALGEGVVETGPAGYMLRLEPSDLDAVRFESLLVRGRGLLTNGNAREAEEVLRGALGLWRGPPLAEFRYEAFARDAIARLEELRVLALEHRLEADLALGRHAEAVPELEALVREYPLRESLRSLLMLALYRAGRQAEALAAYQNARIALVEELGLDPSESLQQLESAILRHDPALDQRSGVRTQPASVLARPIAAAAHGGLLPLAGATPELVENELRDDVGIVDLGEHRLRRVDRPGRPFKLVEGLPSELPLSNEENVAEPRAPRRHRTLLAALAGVIAAAVAITIVGLRQGGGGKPPERAAANSVGFVDPQSNRLVAAVHVGTSPTALTAGAGAVWVTNTAEGTVDRIDPTTHTVRQTLRVGDGPSGVAFGDGSIWVANGLSGTVARIDPGLNRVVDTIPVGNDPAGIVYAADSIWVANTGDDTITKIDVRSGKPSKTIGVAATELAYGAGTLWASERVAGRVARIDPSTGDIVATISVGNGPAGLAFGSGAAWVANSLDGTVTRIDPETNSIAATVPVGNGPSALAIDSGGVWVSNQFEGTLVRIDPRTNQVTRRISVGNEPLGVAVSDGDVLVSLGQSGAGHRGGTLRLRPTIKRVYSMDTAITYSGTAWQLVHMTNDGLVAFNQASGLAGTQLVPDLAVSLPAPTDGGRTYSFRLRPNIHYSNAKPLQASDVRATFERDFRLAQLPVQYYDGIVGAAQCKKNPKRCDLSRGIVADDAARTVTFHLVAADPEFPYKLALPFAYVLPAGTPQHDFGSQPLPATGPYLLASYRPNYGLRFVRNRYFHEWSRAAQPDGYPDAILVELPGTPDEAVNDVIRGRADAWGSSFGARVPSRSLLTAVETRFASQLHLVSSLGGAALFLNTRIAPFDRLDARRAVNYAADRAAAVQAAGGPDLARATCQILPPSLPGYRPYCPYTAGTRAQGRWAAPDLARARALVAASGTRGMKVTVWFLAQARPFGVYAVKLLRSLGYRAALKLISGPGYFNIAYDSRTKAQVGYVPIGIDYPAASGLFEGALTCSSFLSASSLNNNPAEFCDPRIDREVKQALTDQVADPQAAHRLWERIDRQTVDQAPWVPLVSTTSVYMLSKRVGNFQYSPMWSMLVDQLWVRAT